PEDDLTDPAVEGRTDQLAGAAGRRAERITDAGLDPGEPGRLGELDVRARAIVGPQPGHGDVAAVRSAGMDADGLPSARERDGVDRALATVAERRVLGSVAGPRPEPAVRECFGDGDRR